MVTNYYFAQFLYWYIFNMWFLCSLLFVYIFPFFVTKSHTQWSDWWRDKNTSKKSIKWRSHFFRVRRGKSLDLAHIPHSVLIQWVTNQAGPSCRPHVSRAGYLRQTQQRADQVHSCAGIQLCTSRDEILCQIFKYGSVIAGHWDSEERRALMTLKSDFVLMVLDDLNC